VETFVWLGLQGRINSTVGHVATWAYLLVAFVVLPIYVPAAVLALEPRGRRRATMTAFVTLGVGVAGVLLAAMLRGPVSAQLAVSHLSYGTDLRADGLVVTAYVVATCGSLLFSTRRHVALYGVGNLIAVAVLAKLAIDGFASLWCMWATITAGAIAAYLRFTAGTSGLRPTALRP
jgi:hypothetical protein